MGHAEAADGYRVLVVDDDPIALRSLAFTLETAGFGVWTLAGPIGASQLVLEHSIDVVIVDLIMPAMRGDRLARMLRRNPRLADIPVVIVSGESEERLLAIDPGLDDVAAITKANVSSELVPIVRQLALRKRTGLAVPESRPQMLGSAGVGALQSTEPAAPADPSLPPVAPSLSDETKRHVEEARAALLQDFLERVPTRVAALTHAWEAAAEGDSEQMQKTRRELHELSGECQLLQQPVMARLVAKTEIAVIAAPPGRALPQSMSVAVRAALNTLGRIARAKGSDGIDVEGPIARLEQARVTGLSGEHRRPESKAPSARAQRLLRSILPIAN